MSLGHNPNTITGANLIIQFRAQGIYDNFVQISGAQPDAFLTVGDVVVSETQMGVDGLQSIGFSASEVPVGLNLAANSASVDILENVYNFFVQNKEVVFCDIQVTYPSTRRRRTFKGSFISKTAGGVSKMLDGHIYNFSMVDGGFEQI